MVELSKACESQTEARLAGLYGRACRRFPGFRKVTRWAMYQALAIFSRRREWTFMNYGYAPLSPEASPLALEPADEPNRYCIQLYAHLAGPYDLSARRVLEVGSGRGGGSSFIARYLAPAEMVGVDFSPTAVAFSRRTHQLAGLRFVHGDAEDLPFNDAGFDAVINVESSHCYASMPRFLGEVARVLRPGGHFLFADFRPHAQLPLLHQQLLDAGLRVIRQEDITPNVLAAIEADNARKLAQIGRLAPRLLQRWIAEFAGAPGSKIYADFTSGHTAYISYTLQRPA